VMLGRLSDAGDGAFRPQTRLPAQSVRVLLPS